MSIATDEPSARNLRFFNGDAPKDASGAAVSGGSRSSVGVIGCTRTQSISMMERRTHAPFGSFLEVGSWRLSFVDGLQHFF
jgi:hypothetical protein